MTVSGAALVDPMPLRHPLISLQPVSYPRATIGADVEAQAQRTRTVKQTSPTASDLGREHGSRPGRQASTLGRLTVA